jgi:hypothetical protein
MDKKNDGYTDIFKTKNFDDIYNLFKYNDKYSKNAEYSELFEKLKKYVNDGKIQFYKDSYIREKNRKKNIKSISIFLKQKLHPGTYTNKLWIQIEDNIANILYISSIKDNDNRVLISGTELLNFCIIISKLLNVSLIMLDDSSKTVDFNVNLRYLNILSNGDSLYNKLGFRSKNNNSSISLNKKNSTKNKKFIDQKYIDVFNKLKSEVSDVLILRTLYPSKKLTIKSNELFKLIRLLKNIKIIDDTQDSFDNLVKDTNEYINSIISGNVSSMSIKDVFTTIKEKLPLESKDRRHIAIILFLVELFGSKIVYNSKLYRNISTNKNNMNNMNSLNSRNTKKNNIIIIQLNNNT